MNNLLFQVMLMVNIEHGSAEKCLSSAMVLIYTIDKKCSVITSSKGAFL